MNALNALQEIPEKVVAILTDNLQEPTEGRHTIIKDFDKEEIFQKFEESDYKWLVFVRPE